MGGEITTTIPASAPTRTTTRTTTRTRTSPSPKTTTPKTKTMMNNERIQKRIQELINAANYEINVDAYRGAFDNDNDNNNNDNESNTKINDIRKYNSGRQFYLKCRDALHLCNADYHPTTNTNTNTNNNNNNNG